MFDLLDIVMIYKLKNYFTKLNNLVGIYLSKFENNYKNIFLISNRNLKKT